MAWLKKSFGFTSPFVAKNIRRIVSAVGNRLPESRRQMAERDNPHRLAIFAWLIPFDDM
jgi:hypothetical protein